MKRRDGSDVPLVPVDGFPGVAVPPRTCRTSLRIRRSSGTVEFSWKSRYDHVVSAIEAMHWSACSSYYRCPNCDYWHISRRTDQRTEE